MGGLWSGQSCRNETLELASVALWRRIGLETIPNETTPFHIDRGMKRVYLLERVARLLFVGSGTEARPKTSASDSAIQVAEMRVRRRAAERAHWRTA